MLSLLPVPGRRLSSLLFILAFCGVGLMAQDYPYGIPRAKPKAYRGWEIHGAVSTSIPDFDYWRVSQPYRISDSPGADYTFVRDDGALIYADWEAEISSRNPDRPVVNDKLYQLGINRITHWGGILRFSLGYYRTEFRMRNDAFADLRPDEVRTFFDDKEQSVMAEVGFHYSFLRRHRFRPYVGGHFTTHLYYKGRSVERFIEGGTGQTGFVQSFTSTEYFPIYPDYSLTVGFQYQLTERISAGAFVWVNNGYDLWLDAPLGAEVRYSLWDRPLRKKRRRER